MSLFLIAALLAVHQTDTSGIEAVKASGTVFHQRVAAAERDKQPANGDLLAAATRFEHDLRDWITLGFPSETAQLAALRRSGVLAGGKGQDTVEITHPAAYPEALLIRVALHVPGGSDGAAWLYEKRENKWVRTLALERGQQRSASQLGPLAISPGDASDSHLLLAYRTTVSEGCLHPVSFQLYRVGVPTQAPLLMDDWHAADLCKAAPVARAEASGFTLELQDRDLAPGTTRTHVLRYKLVAEHPLRVQPVAGSPQEFVAEWLEREWKEAIDWTAPASRGSLQKIHDQLRGGSPAVRGEYKSASRCGGTGDWDIAIDLAGRGLRHFAVKDSGGNEFQLVSVGESGCSTH